MTRMERAGLAMAFLALVLICEGMKLLGAALLGPSLVLPVLRG